MRLSIRRRLLLVMDGCSSIPVYRSGEIIAWAKIDRADYSIVSGCRWRLGNGYVKTDIKKPDGKWKTVDMHILIMGPAPEGFEWDHSFGDKLDNRRSKLRLATRSENLHNTGKRCSNSSGHKGVSFHKRVGKWQARISVAGSEIYLGLFATASEAAIAYDAASKEHFGEFAR